MYGILCSVAYVCVHTYLCACSVYNHNSIDSLCSFILHPCTHIVATFSLTKTRAHYCALCKGTYDPLLLLHRTLELVVTAHLCC